MIPKGKFCQQGFRATGIALALSGIATSNALAQEMTERKGSVSVLLEEVVVTALKRDETAQDVPLYISTYNSDQLDALKVRDLTNLSVGMPNVALDDIGTTRGTANFSIRGLGINSSIPSIDPTVGVFVDGVYMGMNNGLIYDMFDLESIEVLRGPQGTLFGRNVTAGAVLLNSKRPTSRLEGSFKVAADTGENGNLNQYVMGTIGGPVTDSLGAKIAVYYNDDDGWFKNEFDGDNFGAITQKMVRPVVVWEPTDSSELILRYTYTDISGDGPAAQSHTNGSGVPGSPNNWKRDSHKFSIDDEGYQTTETHFLTAEFNVDVDFGEGTITNIFGWRDLAQEARSDVDAQPVARFHAPTWLDSEQFSNELRYIGTFIDERAEVSSGVYYFTNDVDYHERREFLGGLQQADGGGDYNVTTYGIFAAIDYDLTDEWTLSAGIRYTKEEKEADIASLINNVSIPSIGLDNSCNIVDGPDCPYDFEDDDTWESWSPKLGFSYSLDFNAQIYGHWTRGFRSGGYNLRNSSADPADVPGPFDQETVDNFEVGYKTTFERGRLNAAVFFNQIQDMQRELNLPSQGVGVVQLVRNTADADIYGIEVDGTYSLTDTLLLTASVGWLDASYTDVKFDLNGDGVVDSQDKKLDLPRAADLTYSVALAHDLTLGDWGYVTSRISYAYRDESAYTDNNLGYILDQKIVDAGFDFYSNDQHWVFSLYGQNLTDEVKHGGDTQLPDSISVFPVGGTFAPLSKGRVYGAGITYNFF